MSMTVEPEPDVRPEARWRRRPRNLGALGAALSLMVVATAVVALHRPSPVTPRPPVVHHDPAPTTTVPPPPPSPVPAMTTIATVTGAVPYFGAPNGWPAGTIPIGSWWGLTKELPVIDQAPGWLEVRLPQRPNGLTGWIPSSSATLSQTTYGILIDVTTRRLQLYQQGHVVLDFPAGVGTTTDPTPLGQYYVMEITPPQGPGYGPFMLDTNAHSDAILSWEGTGDAFTAIHGPISAGADAEIGTVGAAISHGCVRLHDADLAQLDVVPAGAPVVITA
jgi:lipoprotein-anchoring transpeptidase ErfK/SrfK